MYDLITIISEISNEKNLDMLKKGSLRRETESLLIEAQNNAIETMPKQKQTRRKRMGDIAYAVIEIKRSITK